LELNGTSYLSRPFYERRRALEELFKENSRLISDKTVALAYQIVTKNPKDLEKKFNESVAKGFEGIMVKRNDAVYQAGARNFNWIKFKHHGEGKLSDTLDCLVMGYYAGKGKRSGFGIGAFLVGVIHCHPELVSGSKDFIDSGSQSGMTYRTIAKIGTGLTDEQWKKLESQSSKLKVQEKPSDYDVPKELVPDYWTKPAIVVEIAADEITKSPLHTAGLALRFPRLVRFRDDKSPQDVTTVKEVESLFTLQ
jgi:DNA ligase-1